MSDRYFLDTNIFIYTFDETQPQKRTLARQLVSQALGDSKGTISYQVIQEFMNIATRKFRRPLTPPDCAAYLDAVLAPMCEVFPSIDLYRDALDLHEKWKFSYYDSLIVTAALSVGCRRLYSEDLQHGQKVRDLVIENPFADTS